MSKTHHECYSNTGPSIRKYEAIYTHSVGYSPFLFNHHFYVDQSQICVSEPDVFLNFTILNLPVPFYLVLPSGHWHYHSQSSRKKIFVSSFIYHSPLFLLVFLSKCLFYLFFLFNLYLYHPILFFIYHGFIQQLFTKFIPGARKFLRDWRYKRKVKHWISLHRAEKSGQKVIKLESKQVYNCNIDNCSAWKALGAIWPYNRKSRKVGHGVSGK